MIVVAAERADFPRQTEALLLDVAANQAVIGLQEARLRSRQKRVADELDRKVGERTAELVAANAELRLKFPSCNRSRWRPGRSCPTAPRIS